MVVFDGKLPPKQMILKDAIELLWSTVLPFVSGILFIMLSWIFILGLIAPILYRIKITIE